MFVACSVSFGFLFWVAVYSVATASETAVTNSGDVVRHAAQDETEKATL